VDDLADSKRFGAIIEDRDMSEFEKKSVLSRRNVLRNVTALAGGAAIAAASLRSAAAQSGKMTQQAAAYQNGPKNGQKCLDCSFYIQPQACKLVEGTISPVGWCKFYAKKAA
jgi:hypothetical protein